MKTIPIVLGSGVWLKSRFKPSIDPPPAVNAVFHWMKSAKSTTPFDTRSPSLRKVTGLRKWDRMASKSNMSTEPLQSVSPRAQLPELVVTSVKVVPRRTSS